MQIIDLEQKRKELGSYLDFLQDETQFLLEYLSSRGLSIEQARDLLDFARFTIFNRSEWQNGGRPEEGSDGKPFDQLAMLELIEAFRSQQGLPGWSDLSKKPRPRRI